MITTEFIGDTIADIYVVFEPEQIHILGSKQDIEGFKKYVEKDVSLDEPIDLENNKFCE